MLTKKKGEANKAGTSNRTHEKNAEKALAVAEDAVAAAREAAKKSRKKLQKKAARLTRETQRMSKKLAKAQREVSQAEAALSAETTPPSSEAADTPAAPDSTNTGKESVVTTETRGSAAGLTPPLPQPERAPATLVELRREAKSKGIRGYSRLTKADLIVALEADGSSTGQA